MSLTNNKLRSNLRERFLQEQEKSRRGNADPRFLNYYDLKDGQQMEILLLPDGDDSGELFRSYSSHGGGLKTRFGTGTINCSYSSSGIPCPVCAYSYALYKEGSTESREWMANTHFIAQAIVVSVPQGFELNQPEDGNLVRLLWLPFSVKELIVDSIINETIPDPTEHVLVLKRTVNKGNFAAYDKSFFKPVPVVDADLPASFLSQVDAGKLKPYNLVEFVPAPTTAEQVQAWFDKALATPVGRTASQIQSSSKQETVRTGMVQTERVVAAQPAIATVAAPKTPPEVPTALPVPQAGMSLRERLEARRRAQTE